MIFTDLFSNTDYYKIHFYADFKFVTIEFNGVQELSL